MTLRYHEEGRVAYVYLDRPDKHNALNRLMLWDLRRELKRIAGLDHLSALVIGSTSDVAFSVGADLSERQTMSDAEVLEYLQLIGETLALLEDLPIPTVAAINGYALGGGLELALACDLRVASYGAMLGLTEVRLGIIPGAGGTARLSRLVPLTVAKEMILMGRRVSAEEALSTHLVNAVFPREGFDEAVRTYVAPFTEVAPLAVRAAKWSMVQGAEVDLARALKFERIAYQTLLGTEDRREGLLAFHEKRPPTFRGR
ncbi:MAG: Enoyl-CoA hydratase [Candidatus Carbobacillus altaicus]|uniref:Enoyl-CoA hydratase n=1 Tax=Candidatus Carbonibacillus altaicus TaxID=2163959 RepID=A0A2R6Y1H4_9BACL|nr:MAG: Enoyl-CoA hydratase [Candidatus Carbobacillus altaicus]